MILLSTNTFLYSIIASFFLILVIIFLFQSLKFKRSVPFLLTSLSLGFIGATFATLQSLSLAKTSLSDNILLSTQLSLYGLQIFFFLLFLQSLESIRYNELSIYFSLSFLLLQWFGLWSIVHFDAFSPVKDDMWLIADLGYTLNALLVYLINGIPLYIRMGMETRETKPYIFAIALSIISIGYIYLTILDVTHFLGKTPDWINDISIIGDLLPLLGLFLFMILYLTDFNYIYRLPYDNFILVVALKHGPAIHAVEFETKRDIQLQKDLISGLLTSVNQIFNVEFHSDKPLTLVKSEDINILLETGEHVTIFIITENTSKVLRRSLRRYLREFENQYKEPLVTDATKVDVFDDATDLIKPIFPFMKIKRFIEVDKQ